MQQQTGHCFISGSNYKRIKREGLPRGGDRRQAFKKMNFAIIGLSPMNIALAL